MADWINAQEKGVKLLIACQKRVLHERKVFGKRYFSSGNDSI
jgi:hypothetical protein